jgi:hypothetical protein
MKPLTVAAVSPPSSKSAQFATQKFEDDHSRRSSRMLPRTENLRQRANKVAIGHDTRSNGFLYAQCRCSGAFKPPDY